MATRIALMHDGKIVQLGGPRDLYDAPTSRYAADFFGAANLFEGQVVGSGDGEVSVDSTEAGATLRGRCGDGVVVGKTVTVMVRPEQVRLAREARAADNPLRGCVSSVVFLGSFYACQLRLDSGKTVLARLSPSEFAEAGAPVQGDMVHLCWLPAAARVLVQ